MRTLILTITLFLSFCGYSQEIDLLILNQKYEQALDKISQKLATEPDGDTYFKQGILYSRLQNYARAARSFQSALGFTPNNPTILAELGEVLSKLGNYTQAASFFEQATVVSKENLVLKGKLGRVYINQKSYLKAFEVFDKIYKIDSTNVYWNKQFAFCAHIVGRVSLAIKLYNKVLEQNQHDVGSYINLASLYQKMNVNKQALELILKGLEYMPDNASLQLKLANLYYGTKAYDKAVSSFEKYLTNVDSTYLVLKNYGISLYFNRNEPKAIQLLEKCVEQVPDDPFVLFYLGLGHKKLAQHEIAEAYMNTAIEAATPYYLPEMYHHLGQIYGQQRKFAESIEALKKAYELDPTGHEVLFEIATTYEEYNNNKTLALNFYRMYLLEAKEKAKNATYALNRMDKIKEMLFMDGQ